jgi:hypothetical protein
MISITTLKHTTQSPHQTTKGYLTYNSKNTSIAKSDTLSIILTPQYSKLKIHVQFQLSLVGLNIFELTLCFIIILGKLLNIHCRLNHTSIFNINHTHIH